MEYGRHKHTGGTLDIQAVTIFNNHAPAIWFISRTVIGRKGEVLNTAGVASLGC